MLRFSDNLADLAAALAAAQAELTGAKKSSKNQHFKSTYADLEDSWEALRDILPKHGLSVFQGGGLMEDGKPGFATLLMHTSGQWVEGILPLACKDPSDPQKVGSAVTYMRRYGLQAAVGLHGTDDDGEAASKPAKEQAEQPPATEPEVLQGYIDRINEAEDVGALRGIAGAGLKFYKERGDGVSMEAIRVAGKNRAAALTAQEPSHQPNTRLTQPDITEDGEAVG